MSSHSALPFEKQKLTHPIHLNWNSWELKVNQKHCLYSEHYLSNVNRTVLQIIYTHISIDCGKWSRNFIKRPCKHYTQSSSEHRFPSKAGEADLYCSWNFNNIVAVCCLSQCSGNPVTIQVMVCPINCRWWILTRHYFHPGIYLHRLEHGRTEKNVECELQLIFVTKESSDIKWF